MIEGFPPVVEGHGPFFGGLPQGQKYQLQRRLRVRKSAAGLDDLAQRTVQRLHTIGGIDGSSDVRRIIEKRGDPPPVSSPHLAYAG